ALMEALEVLDQYPLEEVKALPGLPHPQELPARNRSGAAPDLVTETDAPLAYKPITELAHLIRTRQLSPVELTNLYLDRIGRFDGELKSYITVTPEIARAEAQEAERRLAAGENLGPLHGIPLAYKDEYYTRGVRTTCGSMILSEFVPDYDATAVAKLQQAGVTMLGKLNMTEWATPLTLEFPFGHPRNPWNLEHDAGGSSTGSGSATAAALCAASLGEDTGGSIRRPASHDSCVGLRPSWGRVSMHGVIPALWTQDTAGPLGRTVADCALLMNAIAGPDVNDPISANLPVPDYTAALGREVRGLRVGVVTEMLEADHIHPDVQASVREAVRRFEGMGAQVEEISLPLVTLCNLIAGATGSDRTALQWVNLKQHPDQYDAASRRFNLLPGVIPASLYQRVVQLRSLLRQQVLDACERFDILLTPCQPTPPPTIEDTKRPITTKAEALDDLRRYSLSTPAAIAGIPAISLPGGFSQERLPIGLQIMAKRYDEESVFQAAHAYEQHTTWHTMRPPVGDE
ncbi:MAG: amidase, partial [Dehalococcoidia bacterium]